jgi:hypothetical protein
MFINEATWEFVRTNADNDVRKLALQGAKNAEVDLTQALQQIAGRQTARYKLPSWAAVEALVYPPHLNMEQCSSELTARYKAQVAGCGDSFVDLTGGFGVDFYWIAQGFQYAHYVEQNEALCAITEHNFALLGLPCSVSCSTTSAYLTKLDHASLIYLDPARRNEQGARTYGIEDCTPNVLELLSLLMEKADSVLLKLSPMLDWRKAVSDLKYVTEVHIVSVDNECKELLIKMSNEKGERRNEAQGVRVVCVNLLSNGENQVFEFLDGQSRCDISPFSSLLSHFLYEPNASIMKAGCFALLEQRFPVRQLSANSHLFVSPDEIGDFPGRGFQISAVSSMNKKELKQSLAGISQANIAVRNFPMSVQQLRQKLKLKEGGNVYIFATTAQDGAHQLYICRKIG